MSGVVRAACLVPAVVAAHAGSVEGHGSWKGKTLTFRHAYLLTYGSKAYVLLSAADVGEAIRGCPRLECAVWDVLREGVVIEPEENGDFWLRAVHPEVPGERQISYRVFEPTTRGRPPAVGNAGRSPAVTQMDAPLVRRFGDLR